MRALELARYIEDLLSRGELAVVARLLERHGREAPESRKLAYGLVRAVELGHREPQLSSVLATVLDRWVDDPELVLRIARVALANPRELVALVEACVRILPRTLQSLDADEAADPSRGGVLLATFGELSQTLGPRFVPVALRAFETARSLEDRPVWRFAQGLVLKDAGRFEDALECFDALASGPTSAELLWNIAVCATGAGHGEQAVDALRALGFETTLGSDFLPYVSRLPTVRARFASRREGERSVSDVVWVAPRSPCHGVVLSATQRDVGVDRGDVVLWDAVPAGQRAPEVVLRGLARVERSHWAIHRFRAREGDAGQLTDLARRLPPQLELHVHGEARDVQRFDMPRVARHHSCLTPRVVLEGKLAIAPTWPAEDARRVLERVIADARYVVMAIPSLYRGRAGLEEDAAEHQRLWTTLHHLE